MALGHLSVQESVAFLRKTTELHDRNFHLYANSDFDWKSLSARSTSEMTLLAY